MRVFLVIILAWLAVTTAAQELPKDKWVDFQPFLGTWEGVGSGKPGEGSGSFSFAPELQGAVLVRHNYAQYPATKDRPAFRHDDLMVIYPEGHAGITQAEYWDSEGHVIHYYPQFSDNGRKLIFTSAGSEPGPRYRLTYLKTGDNDLKLTIEIAPATAPNKFATYIEATAKRTKN